MLDRPIAEFRQVEAREQVLAGTERHRRHGEVHLIDQAGLQVLPEGCNTAAEPDVLAFLPRPWRVPARPRCRRSTKWNVVPPCMASGARAWWVSTKTSRVVGRRITPPSLPVVVRPRPADGSEHVPPENPGADAVETAGNEVVVDARASRRPCRPCAGTCVLRTPTRAAPPRRRPADCSVLWSGPAPWPSSESEKQWMRSLDIGAIPISGGFPSKGSDAGRPCLSTSNEVAATRSDHHLIG